MKKILGYSLLTGMLVVGLSVLAYPQVVGNGITRAMLQGRAWTFSALQTFGAITVNGTGTGSGSLHLDGGIGATPGNKVNLEGSAGDTYLRRDADTGCWQEWKDGTLGWQLCSDGVVPPDCTSAGPQEFGKFCKDQPTASHGARVLMNTGSGVVILTGTVPVP